MVFNAQIPGPNCTAKAFYTETNGKIDVSEVHIFDPSGVKCLRLPGSQFGSPFSDAIDAYSQIGSAINNIPLDLVKGSPLAAKPKGKNSTV